MTCVIPKSASSTTLARWNVGDAVVAPEHHALEPLRQPRLARRLEVPCGARALAHRALVPVDAEPAQVVEHAVLAARRGSGPGRCRRSAAASSRRSARLATALSALPTWSEPVGLGAKRTRVIAGTLDDGIGERGTVAGASAGIARATAPRRARPRRSPRRPRRTPTPPGSCVPPIVSAVTIAAPTCPPITLPTVRMTVFMPVATPVSVGRTASTISFAIAANANGTPIPMNTIHERDLPVDGRATSASDADPAAASSRPSDERQPRPVARAEPPGDRPGDEAEQPAGQQVETGRRRREPEPVVARAVRAAAA